VHKINHANIKEWAGNYDGPLFDGILCDPPYELGFMGKSWDSSGIAFDTDMWADLFKLVKPGGHLLAFSGSRTYHRMAVAIEDAGFEIRDMIEWVYGSGFPKSLNIGKAVDKIQGNEREVVGYAKSNPDLRDVGRISKETTGIDKLSFGQAQGAKRQQTPIDKGTSEWEGYGTALKPAHEPCVLARKPIDKGMTVAGNVLKHGTGGLNIDGTRVEAEPELAKNWTDRKAKAGFGNSVNAYDPQNPNTTIDNFDYYKATGRFPANLIHDGSDEVEAVFPNNNSRFFYCSKASKSERNAGLEGFEEKMPWTVESQSTLSDSKFPNANHHPTVKPLALTKYLATLIKPPTGGRILVPFSGSGSEMIGALQAGWEYVEGVELTEEYIPIAEARIKHWMSVPVQESLLTTREDK